MRHFKRAMYLLLAVAMVLSSFAGCTQQGGPGGATISNESTRLVLASAELEGVFNPFYSSSAADGSIIGMTQIGMLSSDKEGKVAYGADEACVVLDYETEFVEVLIPDVDNLTRLAIFLYCMLPGSYLAPSLGRTEEEYQMASGVCSILTLVTLAIVCVTAAFVA